MTFFTLLAKKKEFECKARLDSEIFTQNVVTKLEKNQRASLIEKENK